MATCVSFNGEADVLWQKIPKGMRSSMVSKLLLEAYHQGKLDSFLSASESSLKPASAGEYKVEDQKTGGHGGGLGGKKPNGPQQDRQGSAIPLGRAAKSLTIEIKISLHPE